MATAILPDADSRYGSKIRSKIQRRFAPRPYGTEKMQARYNTDTQIAKGLWQGIFGTISRPKASSVGAKQIESENTRITQYLLDSLPPAGNMSAITPAVLKPGPDAQTYSGTGAGGMTLGSGSQTITEQPKAKEPTLSNSKTSDELEKAKSTPEEAVAATGQHQGANIQFLGNVERAMLSTGDMINEGVVTFSGLLPHMLLFDFAIPTNFDLESRASQGASEKESTPRSILDKIPDQKGFYVHGKAEAVQASTGTLRNKQAVTFE
ncbi:hypothetical protein MKZ38_003551 [Zalerion maritima]|uniref:Uncharacterized protein n=1 Tax=Zalerion maritima TaxID=339359 RepID=A0AAD5WRQ3_9PEZI|nr:hypothetical protein MKZ38_003551 [Zalerion maritima]